MVENLDCPVCLDQAKDAVECTQCAQIFCEICTKPLQKCPMCRASSSFKISAFARKFINNLPKKCDFCEFTTTCVEIKYHMEKCEFRRIDCNLCNFKGLKKEFISHIINTHSAILLSNFTSSTSEPEIKTQHLWENQTTTLKHSFELLTTQTSLTKAENVKVDIRVKSTKNPAFIVLGFSSTKIHLANGKFLGGDLGKGNWGIAGNGALGEEGKWGKGETFKQGDLVTLIYQSGTIKYSINGKQNGYSYSFSKTGGNQVYIAASLFNEGDVLEIVNK